MQGSDCSLSLAGEDASCEGGGKNHTEGKLSNRIPQVPANEVSQTQNAKKRASVHCHRLEYVVCRTHREVWAESCACKGSPH